MFALDPAVHIWVTYAIIAGAIIAYSMEKIPLELTSIGVLALLLLFFYFFPVADDSGGNVLSARRLLAGFSDPALVAIVALLVIGQGLVQTGALDNLAQKLVDAGVRRPTLVIVSGLLCVLLTSAVLNNTPVVVIFIPIMSALGDRLGRPASSLMMPLSFVAILGGMTTLIGSSTNLLVAGELARLGEPELGFFEFTVPGLVLASVGLLYILFIIPKILPERASLSAQPASDGKQFIAQIEVTPNSPLVGEKAVAGMFPTLPGMTVRMVQCDGEMVLPPFEDITLSAGDVVIVAATRKTLTEALSRMPMLLESVPLAAEQESAAMEEGGNEQILAEAVVAPASRMDGRTLEQIGFYHQTHCIVLGVQRRSRMFRSKMNEIRLEAGDVLLIAGHRRDVLGLRANKDVLLMEWSTHELPTPALAFRAIAIFLGVVGFAASAIVPIAITAVAGAGLMIALGCLNIRQAARAIDRRVVMMIAAALAMGAALQETGGAAWLAHGLVAVLGNASAPVLLSAFFLLVTALTNVLSNNATAVLFTPIAVSMAHELGVDPRVFVYAVIFAANCSFATPMSYQTNLLVMGPGHYRFSDYMRAGAPLIVVLWAAYSLFAPWYYGLM